MKKPRGRKGRPAQPTTAISARLEEVRARKGIGTISEFRRVLTDPARGRNGKPYSISDSAIRNYQFGTDPEGTEREPPFSYLARVCEVFSDVNPDWLLTGDGLPTRQQQDQGFIETIRTAIRAEFANLGVDPDRFVGGTEAVLEAWSTIAPLLTAPEHEGARGRELTHDEEIALVRTLVQHVVAPARTFGIDLANLRGGILLGGHYAALLCQAITALLLADSVILYSSPTNWTVRQDLFAYLAGERPVEELESDQ